MSIVKILLIIHSGMAAILNYDFFSLIILGGYIGFILLEMVLTDSLGQKTWV